MSTPLTVQQFASYGFTLTVNGPNGPMSLTSFEVLGQVRDAQNLNKVAAVFTCELTGQPGKVRCSLTASQTGALTRTSLARAFYVYDIVLRRPSDDWRKKLIGGPLTVQPGVTR
jgi:hypothetical protein